MAEASGISASSVRRIWRSHGLQPHRSRRFKLSNDPQFVEAARVLALLLHLSHGLWTATSDLGITGARWRKVMLFLSGLIPLLVVVGNIAIPVAVLTGLVG